MHDHDAIRQLHDINFVLPNANSLDEYLVFASGIEQQRDFRGRARQASQESARRHRANEHACVAGVPLHANAITENRAAGVRASGIDSNHAHCFVLPPIESAPDDPPAYSCPYRARR